LFSKRGENLARKEMHTSESHPVTEEQVVAYQNEQGGKVRQATQPEAVRGNI